MATRVGLIKFWTTLYDWPTPNTPSLVQNSGTYLKCELSYGDFCMKIICYLGNRRWSDTNFTCTVKSADPQNPPIWCKNLGDRPISYTSWVMADFLTKFANFCCHGNKGGSNKNLNDSVWLVYPKKPQCGAKMGPILNGSWVMVNFVWKFPIFVTMATGVV